MADILYVLKRHKKALMASSLGTIMEWYDFFMFGILANTISKHFFPANNERISLLYTLMAFAVSFVVRPLGGLLFGYIGDTLGRKPSLVWSIALMGISSTAMGLVPGYETVGMWAPIAVIVLRILQGIALGGEYAGAAIFIAERELSSHRSFITSFLQTTSSIGFVLSLLVAIVLRVVISSEGFEAWGWRLAFLISICWILPSLYIRTKLAETPLFHAIKKHASTTQDKPIFFLRKYKNIKLTFLVIVGLTMGQGITSYVVFYPLYFLNRYHTIPAEHIDTLLLLSSLFIIPVILLMGYISDKVGCKRMIFIGMFLSLVSYFPSFNQMHYLASSYPTQAPLLNTQSIEILAILCVMKFFFAMSYAPLIAMLVGLFPIRIRYSGISFAYNIGNGIFGGIYPAVSSYLALRPLLGFSPHLSHLLYPAVLIGISLIVGSLFIPNVKT